MSTYRIVKNGKGLGGFLCPPGHWNHTYVANEYRSGHDKEEPSGIFSLDSVMDQDTVFPVSIRNQVQKIMDQSTLILSEKWVRYVYGFFVGIYVPESGDRKASELICSHTPVPGLVHAATAHIRDFFPDHQPREDLITYPGKGYGSWPCVKCGQKVQYEPRLDAHVVSGMGESGVDCPEGGKHHVED